MSPPYFTNGMLRRASSTSSRREWCAARKSTACRFNAIPASRCSSTRSDHVVHLRRLVPAVTSRGCCSEGRGENRRLGKPSGASPMTALAASRNGLSGAVVLLQGHDCGGRLKQGREVEDVPDRRGAKDIDGLRVVAHDGEPAAVGLQGEQDAGLERVGVLVFVDQHVIEPAPHDGRRPVSASGAASRAGGHRSRGRCVAASPRT